MALATEFNDSAHWGFFMTGTTLTSQTGKYLRQSELTLAALRSQGVFSTLVDGITPPTTDKLWLDKNTDPAVLKEWDSIGSAWAPITFDRLFGRAIVTPMATPTGTGNAVVVAQPSPFIPNRLYSLTPIADNSGAVTIQVTGVGTFSAKYTNGTDLEAQEFKAGNPTILLFTGGRFEVLFKVADIYEVRDDVADMLGQFPGHYITEAAFEAAHVPFPVQHVSTAGYYSPGDGGAHFKRRIPTPSPVKAWHKQSADGAWWEVTADEPTPRMFGAKADTGGGSDGAIAASDATFTSASSSFSSADIGKRVFIVGAGAAGAFHTTTIASINSASSVELTVAAATTVSGAKWFYGTDDLTAIQNTVDFSQAKYKPLKMRTGTYLVSGTISVPNSFGFKMYGVTWQVSSEVEYGAKIRTTSDNPILDVAPAQFSIEGIALEGTDSATSKGVYIHRSVNADDMDSNISRCTFGDFNKAIIQEGRGLWLFATNFVNCDVCQDHSWPTSGVDATNDVQALPQGFRGNRIVNCRAHSCGIMVNTTGADSQYYRGLVMVANLMDIGDQLFKGGLIHGIISQNVVEYCNVMDYAVELERGGTGVKIDDNIFNQGNNDGSVSNSSYSAIRVYSTASLVGASISRNKIANWYRDGILIECAATDSNFDGNNITNIGHSGDPVYACLRFNSVALTRCSIVGGTLNSTVATAKNLSFQGAGSTITDSIIAFITHDTTKDLIGTTFTDGGGNTILRGNGTLGTTEAGFFGIGTISPLNR